jgi:ketosteroid isomerase-like protein
VTASPDGPAGEVLAAAADLVASFAAHDTVRYFAAFAPEASFVFHTTPQWLPSRADYERLWASWEADGLRVESCVSTEQAVSVVADDTAVFTHRVRTRLAGEDQELRERETIVFRRQGDGTWTAVHEHLSPDPDA